MKRLIGLPALLLVCALASASMARADEGAPAWGIQSFAAPTNFVPSEPAGVDVYEVFVTNVGGAPTDGSPIVIKDTLPPRLAVTEVDIQIPPNHPRVRKAPQCSIGTNGVQSVVSCRIEGEQALRVPDEEISVLVHVGTPAGEEALTNTVAVEGGGAPSTEAQVTNRSSASVAPFGFQEFHAAMTNAEGQPAAAAGGHPFQYSTTFAINTELSPPNFGIPFQPATGSVKQVEVTLPPGFLGNPLAASRCPAREFNSVHSVLLNGASLFENECPLSSAVGVVALQQLEGEGGTLLTALYDLVPPKGLPAQFGFQDAAAPVYINAKLRSESDYGVTAFVNNTTQAARVTGARVTLWGTPSAAIHDPLRGICAEKSYAESGLTCPLPPEAERPFLRSPTECVSPLTTSMRISSWLVPSLFVGAEDGQAAPTECDAVGFSPTLGLNPTTGVADSPAGLHVDLHIPQAEHEAVGTTAQADLREAVVTLPPGLLVNPSSAAGLSGCSEEQVGFLGVREGRNSFKNEPAGCPDSSKLGSVEVDTPLVDHPLPGAVYLAQPFENPFDSLLAIYIAVYDPQTGVVVKLPGRVDANPVTGQLTTTVQESPQTPFEDFKLDFFPGDRAPLRTPATCGDHSSSSVLTPYSSPASGPPATVGAGFEVTGEPGGGNCPTSPSAEPNSPSFELGTESPAAGAYSPLILNLSRRDGSQELHGLSVSLPKGLLGKLAGIPYCTDASLAAAASKSGRSEQAQPSCSSASQVGTVNVGAGAGPTPYYVQGKAYLAGPYKGAPLSLAIITPAVAGPFDLGTVVVRTALQVDPETARITAVSDPFPTVLQGIPLDIRSISLRMDRQQFMLNPTSCEPTASGGDVTSVLGSVVHVSDRFQVGNCTKLRFKPKLHISLKGGTKRTGHPALTATLTYPKGGSYANVARVQVALPHAEFLDQGNIGKACTKPVLLARACPAKAIYGKVKAWTPLLEKPLEGPVYLVGGYGYKLPALVAELNGQIRVLLVGKIDTDKQKGIRSTFEAVPDAPVEKFVLQMKGGKKYGLLVNSENICKKKQIAGVAFAAQNGKRLNVSTAIANSCKPMKQHKGARHAKKK